MPTIDVSDTTLYYERSGDGAAMIFVHCAFGDGDSWAGQAQRFGDRHTVVGARPAWLPPQLARQRPGQLCAAPTTPRRSSSSWIWRGASLSN
jgi:hypothetical protein